MSVSISGSTQLLCQQMGTWTAAVCGGAQPYHYQWSYNIVCGGALRNNANVVRPLLPPCGYWIAAGDNSPTFHDSYCSDFEVMCEVTDALNHTATSNTIYVTVGSLLKLATTSPKADMPLVENTNEKAIAMSGESFEQKLISDQSFIQNYPNPFNPTTTISYSLPEEGRVQIKIFDALGHEVITLLDGVVSPGKHTVEWNASKSASGIYFYSIEFKGQRLYKKMLLVK